MTKRLLASSLAGMSSVVWTDEENNLIVADYFAMLADDIVGRHYSKAEIVERSCRC